jgi:hypothetical protein
MPQEYINDKQFLTVAEEKILSCVRGQTPPFAKVDATTAISVHGNSRAHICKYISIVLFKSVPKDNMKE